MSDEDSKTSEDGAPQAEFLSEDWLATIVGLVLLALAMAGLIPESLLW